MGVGEARFDASHRDDFDAGSRFDITNATYVTFAGLDIARAVDGRRGGGEEIAIKGIP